MRNWISDLGLHCESNIRMSLISSIFLTGIVIGSFILPRAADIYGRKPIFLTGSLLFVIVQLCILGLADSLEQIYVLMFISGIAVTGKYHVGYVYCVEMMPKHA